MHLDQQLNEIENLTIVVVAFRYWLRASHGNVVHSNLLRCPDGANYLLFLFVIPNCFAVDLL